VAATVRSGEIALLPDGPGPGSRHADTASSA
jgi:hypothetical protein